MVTKESKNDLDNRIKSQKAVEVVNSKNKNSNHFNTDEGIKIKNRYTSKDISDSHHLDSIAGIPPFVRGPYSSMYTKKPWTIRQ